MVAVSQAMSLHFPPRQIVPGTPVVFTLNPFFPQISVGIQGLTAD